MNANEFKAIRKHLGMDLSDFGSELGLAGTSRNNANRVAEYERGKKPIPAYLARLAFMIREHFDAENGHLPEWPESCLVPKQPIEGKENDGHS